MCYESSVRQDDPVLRERLTELADCIAGSAIGGWRVLCRARGHAVNHNACFTSIVRNGCTCAVAEDASGPSARVLQSRCR